MERDINGFTSAERIADAKITSQFALVQFQFISVDVAPTLTMGRTPRRTRSELRVHSVRRLDRLPHVRLGGSGLDRKPGSSISLRRRRLIPVEHDMPKAEWAAVRRDDSGVFRRGCRRDVSDGYGSVTAALGESWRGRAEERRREQKGFHFGNSV